MQGSKYNTLIIYIISKFVYRGGSISGQDTSCAHTVVLSFAELTFVFKFMNMYIRSLVLF